MRTRTSPGLSYKVLSTLKTIKERYEYLRLGGVIGESTFGGERWLNQVLYTSKDWRDFRNEVIIRDNGCDLGIEGYEIHDKIIIHHINPLSVMDVYNKSPRIFDMDNVICASDRTHRAIHFGDETLLPVEPIIRCPGDTCEWKSIKSK